MGNNINTNLNGSISLRPGVPKAVTNPRIGCINSVFSTLDGISVGSKSPFRKSMSKTLFSVASFIFNRKVSCNSSGIHAHKTQVVCVLRIFCSISILCNSMFNTSLAAIRSIPMVFDKSVISTVRDFCSSINSSYSA